MADKTQKPITIRLPVAATRSGAPAPKALPRILQASARGAPGASDQDLAGLITDHEVFELVPPRRGDAQEKITQLKDNPVVALETADGTTIFIRADKLKEDLDRVHPAEVRNGELNLEVLRDRDPATRGFGDWVWSKFHTFRLGSDGIVEAARDQATEWAKEWLGKKIAAEVDSVLGTRDGFSVSALGAKALMRAIESRLAGEPGLYRWKGGQPQSTDRMQDKDDPALAAAAKAGPILVFIHGTGSQTSGSFQDLRASSVAGDWAPIARKFGDRVFGFEHRTFSESPIDNALALASILPAGAKLSLVTHSRGGLVGDLLCLDDFEGELIKEWRTKAPGEEEKSPESPAEKEVREKIAQDERAKLARLSRLLKDRDFQLERYIRIACPAAGTTLLSDNLEVFLSGFLSLMGKLVGTLTGPAGGAAFSVLKRIVLEVADKRLDARLVPGIEAMLAEAPMGRLLARAPRKQKIDMAVIAGDTEGGSLIKRIGVMFTDWMFFDRVDNDLVVDTNSMYAGIARGPGARYLFDQGSDVSHFSYFENRPTRTALRDWLTADNAGGVAAFRAIEARREPTQTAMRSQASRSVPKPDSRPVVILLPGIMGSHLEIRKAGQKRGEGNRIWLDLEMVGGGMGGIRFNAPDVYEETLFDMFYGDLARHLESSHLVIRFPYDWRQPIQDTAEKLAQTVDEALNANPSQPVRLLAHSMGGLVARAMIAQKPELWKRICDRPGGRFVMLGTPNNGSHLMVETLLGKSDTIRKLARLDVKHGIRRLLGIIAEFPGAVQLLPRQGFEDRGRSRPGDYFQEAAWQELRVQNTDRWFGDHVVGIPSKDAREAARELWETVLCEKTPDNRWIAKPFASADRVAYVYGQASNTPCGTLVEGGRLRMIGTTEGDGSVSWAAGELEFLPPDRRWHMPASHGDLANKSEHFPAITELLQLGATEKLGRLPVARGVGAVRTYDAGPVSYPTDEEIMRGLMGATPRARSTEATRQQLSLRVVAMDLRYSQIPVLCSHFAGDPIAGAERQIDQYIVAHELTKRERLGVYASEIGSSAIALCPQSDAEKVRGTRRGAVIVGLGDIEKLTASLVTETVRTGVLRFLLLTADQHDSDRPGQKGVATEVQLAALLIGTQSTQFISVQDSIEAVVLGVCEANRQFEQAMDRKVQVGTLEFIELFLDTAITAQRAARELPERLSRDLDRLKVQLTVAPMLVQRDGARPRLLASTQFGYWPRLSVTNDDARASKAGSAETESRKQELAPAQRLKYVYFSARARAEEIAHQSQPGLIEALVQEAIRVTYHNPDLARTLFQLMLPLDFKAAARNTERLILVVDEYTANLPWEMLQADEEPLVTKTALVRQFVTSRFRPRIQTTKSRRACIIVDPSTSGYAEQFGSAGDQALPALSGAVEEGNEARALLEANHYDVEFAGSGTEALEVFSKLFKHQYRILLIAAHGVVGAKARDGSLRTGVVLSGGRLLTAAEIGQMEVVPELVFLNCCHLGEMSATAYNRLAYSIARELIEMGVRCVVAAGWAVDDQAARTFARVFFDEFVTQGRPFGDSVHQARKITYRDHRGLNTWGAYQAYGDPAFVLEPGLAGATRGPFRPVAIQELIDQLDGMKVEVTHNRSTSLDSVAPEVARVLSGAPPEWRDLPEVQSALGALYAEFGRAGFESARQAYLRAIAEEDKAGRVPVKAIEQLANQEVRTARKLLDEQLEARTARQLKEDQEAALGLVENAISRLQALINLSQSIPTRSDTASERKPMSSPLRPNAERQSLLGSAFKVRAVIKLRLHRKPDEFEFDLQEARNAYQAGEGDIDSEEFSTYAALNRLQLDALLEDWPPAERQARIDRVKLCASRARAAFARSYDFFDAVKVADAELAIALLNESVAGDEVALLKKYNDEIANVPRSERQLDSVVKQLKLLAEILEGRGGASDVKVARTLRLVANGLDPTTKDAAARTPAHSAPPDNVVLLESAKLARDTAVTGGKPRPKKNSRKATRRRHSK